MYVMYVLVLEPWKLVPMRVMGLNGHVQGAHHLLQTLSPQVVVIHAVLPCKAIHTLTTCAFGICSLWVSPSPTWGR